MKKNCVMILALASATSMYAQQKKDKAEFRDKKPGYFQTDIMKSINDGEKKDDTPQKSFRLNMTNYDVPKDVTKYTKVWYNDPVSQGCTNTCWCFSTTSYFESEIYRIAKKKVRLSEMYTVYYEYIEKAKRFVRERGNSAFGEGSEANAVTWMFREHGIVPLSAYSGQKEVAPFYFHTRMYNEMNAYLQKVKENNAWNEGEVVSTIKSILNFYMGEPPAKVNVDGREMTPMEYMKGYCKFNPDDYVDVMSLMEVPYFTKAEYKVPDNWWHSKEYYNIPLADYMEAIKNAIRSGYSIALGGDFSEPGLDKDSQAAIVPTFDIPSEYIDESAREMRYNNGTTTDDHGVHLVGYLEKDGKDWYLIKDSGSGSRNCGKDNPCFGYYFMSEDYLKLKIMDFCIHKDAVKDLLKKFSTQTGTK